MEIDSLQSHYVARHGTKRGAIQLIDNLSCVKTKIFQKFSDSVHTSKLGG